MGSDMWPQLSRILQITSARDGGSTVQVGGVASMGRGHSTPLVNRVPCDGGTASCSPSDAHEIYVYIIYFPQLYLKSHVVWMPLLQTS